MQVTFTLNNQQGMKILISVLLNMRRVVTLEVKRNGVNKGTVSYLKILNGVTRMCYVL